ncbi:hypothetical protein C9374_010596 [Naegleria lovaniensis]|uniref:Uncharacterized protein n=1 Tax=Naegleria lovaniensis TaxID=51637 RepID=A0AA88GFC9_NAELO|nr:uncharacterized protein C9374_010596 [Naegleria lovaniensis]KAG2374577.1 hypothetical protein C9374_010596 [Naegleria lovaniensis]
MQAPTTSSRHCTYRPCPFCIRLNVRCIYRMNSEIMYSQFMDIYDDLEFSITQEITNTVDLTDEEVIVDLTEEEEEVIIDLTEEESDVSSSTSHDAVRLVQHLDRSEFMYVDDDDDHREGLEMNNCENSIQITSQWVNSFLQVGTSDFDLVRYLSN